MTTDSAKRVSEGLTPDEQVITGRIEPKMEKDNITVLAQGDAC